MAVVTPDALRQRIEAIYIETTRQPSPRGALAWFARQAHVHETTVSRWVTGDREPSGPVIGLLECMEREAGT